MLKVFQHNVGRSGDTLNCLLETAVGTDLVLIQELPARLGYTPGVRSDMDCGKDVSGKEEGLRVVLLYGGCPYQG